MQLNIGIAGTRGIPNRYGGFEQLATFLAAGLVEKGHRVTVYSPHHHPFREKVYAGAAIVHCHDPEERMGTAGQFIYDYNCIRDARKRDFDVLLFLGYTSSSVWHRFFPRRTVIVSNMDGLEWKREKYKPWQQRFLRYAEKLAVRHSDYLISDAPAIQAHLLDSYGALSTCIAYGAGTYADAGPEVAVKAGLQPGHYMMLMARMEPENNIQTILDGFMASRCAGQMLVVGSTAGRYGQWIQERYKGDTRIQFAGGLYDPLLLHGLKQHCYLYFHGHSVGGTNPSLLEAMASSALIAAHDNVFNRGVLDADAFYFQDAAMVTQLIDMPVPAAQRRQMISANRAKIDREYNWPAIINRYETFLRQCCNETKR